MIEKATTMGNWWLAASPQQHTCSCITSYSEFFYETSNLQVTQHPLQPRFGTLWILTFPKLKSPLKGNRFQTVDEIQENTMGSWCRLGELCEVLRYLHWRGLRCHCPMYNISCIFFNKCLFFISHSWILSRETLYILLCLAYFHQQYFCGTAL